MNKNSNDENDVLKKIDFIENEIQNLPRQITWKHNWKVCNMQNAILNSSFIKMPTEMMLKIFGLLSVRDLGSVSLVCRYFKVIVDQDSIWNTRYNGKSDPASLFKFISIGIVSRKINSKSSKQVYIDWIFGKYLRNQRLKILERKYRSMDIGCGLKYSPSCHLIRSIDDASISPTFGFNQHPNSSSDM